MNPSDDARNRRWIRPGLPIAAALVFFALSLDAARLETPTVDEFAHLPAGASYLEHADFALFAKNPPLMKMLATV